MASLQIPFSFSKARPAPSLFVTGVKPPDLTPPTFMGLVSIDDKTTLQVQLIAQAV